MADPAPDPFIKRKNEEARDGPNKRPKVESEEEQNLQLQNNVSPLWNVPYEDQVPTARQQINFSRNSDFGSIIVLFVTPILTPFFYLPIAEIEDERSSNSYKSARC